MQCRMCVRVIKTVFFENVVPFSSKRRLQKRVLREKLTLAVFSGHKPTQLQLIRLQFASCENGAKSAIGSAFRCRFLDGQTLKGPFV